MSAASVSGLSARPELCAPLGRRPAGWLADLLRAVLDVVHADAHDLAHLAHTHHATVSAVGCGWGCRRGRSRRWLGAHAVDGRQELDRLGDTVLAGLDDLQHAQEVTTATRCRRGRREGREGREGSAPPRRRPDRCRPSSPARACQPRHSPPSDRPPRCSGGLRSEEPRGGGRTGGRAHVSSSTPQWVAPPISNCTMRMLPERARSGFHGSGARKRKCGAHLRSPAPPAFCSRASTAAASAATLS